MDHRMRSGRCRSKPYAAANRTVVLAKRLLCETRRSRALLAAVLVAAVLGLFITGSSQPGEAFQGTETLTPTPPPTATPTPVPSSTPLPSPTPTDAAPTLVPPTPLPTLTPTPFQPPTESGLATAQSDNVLRVGTLYNAYPFAWLNEQGDVTGYEADILKAIGIELSVDVEFVQVTRHNADETLLSGQVDMLIGQQVHTRDREQLFDFTHPYYLNQERMVVMTDAPYSELGQMASLPVSVEMGSRSERALSEWSAQTGVQFDLRPYLSESAALDALANGEVQGMVGELDSLSRAGRQHMRLIDAPVLDEYYCIAVRRWDVNLLNLLDRSLQRLKASGRLDEIFSTWFPGSTIDFTTLVPVYEMLYDDQRQLGDFPSDIPYPQNPVLKRLDSGQPLRVAGLVAPGQDAPAQARIINALNQALVDEIARRWDVQVQMVPDSVLNAVDLVANGQADLAVGVSPRWDGADRVDYSLPYIKHGDRLMVPATSNLTGFADMLGTGWWIGYFADDGLDAEHIKKFASYFGVGQNIREPFAIQRESDAIYIMITEQNVKAIYGDNLRLLALMRESDQGNDVKILDDTPYGDDLPITFAVPRNDADFRDRVNQTLQDMAHDGTYQRIWSQDFGMGDPLPIPYWAAVSPDTSSGTTNGQ
jgi:ABC-type amino acid transport substrate-binding protein